MQEMIKDIEIGKSKIEEVRFVSSLINFKLALSTTELSHLSQGKESVFGCCWEQSDLGLLSDQCLNHTILPCCKLKM